MKYEEFHRFINQEMARTITLNAIKIVQPLRITAGYGHDAPRKVWISLRFDHFENELDERSFIETVMNFGCDIHFAVKASSLLIRSGRYDCCVQYGWISRRIGDLRSQLRAVGVTIVMDPAYYPACDMR